MTDKFTDPDYRRDYTRGWRYSSRPTATLDHGDAIGAPDAWYDGYLDLAVGREKWHLAVCEGCDHPIGGPHGTAATTRTP